MNGDIKRLAERVLGEVERSAFMMYEKLYMQETRIAQEGTGWLGLEESWSFPNFVLVVYILHATL
jgi:hypothetical protein